MRTYQKPTSTGLQVLFIAHAPRSIQKNPRIFHTRMARRHSHEGIFWLSSRPDFVGEISQAGAFVRHKGIGRWWASIPKSEWPDRKAVEEAIGHYWTDNYGDRRQEIVFIGLKIR